MPASFLRDPLATSAHAFSPYLIQATLLDFLKTEKKITPSNFVNAILERCSLFNHAFNNAQTVPERRKVLKHYERYLQAWKRCLNTPARAHDIIRLYHDPRWYRPIGCTQYHEPSPVVAARCSLAIRLSLTGLIAGIAASFFCLAAGIGLITFALITLTAAKAILSGEHYLETRQFKQDESDLFTQGADLVKTMNKHSNTARAPLLLC